MPEWGIALIGVAGLILGSIISEIRHWLDRGIRFQVMTFEKRLQAHQEALSWCMQTAILTRPKALKEAKGIENLLNCLHEAIEWLMHNSLYIDENSYVSMLNAFSFAIKQAEEWSNEENHAILDDEQKLKVIIREMGKAAKCIIGGIGAKYLPEIEKQLQVLEIRN